jgi:aminoglycoside phosphotransferase family enzyme/predicted kinase
MPASSSTGDGGAAMIGKAPASQPAPPAIDRLVEALRDPACYGHPVDGAVEVIETHISFVLLAGGFAYKLKKPLDLGFLDFSSLDRRRHCCEEEVRLNRRLAPAIYLDVVGIRWDGSKPVIDGLQATSSGLPCAPPVIEYAVRMRAFAQQDLLDRRLADGLVDASEIDAIAHTVAGFHAQIDRASAGSAFGTPEAAWKPVRENFDTLAKKVRDPHTRRALAALARWSRAERSRLASWFTRRQAGGFVRECHGDLHLGNIARVDGEICVFDCIEFNPALRWIDVASEIAFTVMDLADRGRADLGWRLLDRWLAATGDYDALTGLPFYMVYRALVRAKVAGLRSDQPHVDSGACARLQDELRTYVALAGELSRARPLVAITHGLSGSGKSHGSQMLVERFGAVRVRSDVERKRLRGLAPDARDGAAIGSALYDHASTELTYARLAGIAESAVAAGVPVIIDAAFLDRPRRDRFRALAARLHAPFAILDFVVPEAELRARVLARERAGRDASDAGIEVLHHQIRNARPLDPDERAFAVTIDASNAACADSLARAVEALQSLLHSIQP